MKPFKIIALIAGLLALLVLIPIGVLVSVDLNHYKDTLAQTVEKHTGRRLQIDGPLDKSFFPWLGVHIGGLQLSNASGFGDAPFVQLGEVQVKIKLLPLFKGELVVDKVVVYGLTLNLARNRQGAGNWDDLTAREAAGPAALPAPEAPATTTAPTASAAPITKRLAALQIGGVDIRDAAVNWDDRLAGARYELSDLAVQTGELRLGQAFRADVSFQFNATEPQAQGTVHWSALVDAQPQQQRYRMQDVKLTADIRGERLPVPQLSLALAADVEGDLEKQTANLSGLTLRVLGSELSGKAQAQHILAEPQIAAQLQWQVKDPAALVEGLQPLLPPTFKGDWLKNATLQLDAAVSLGEQTAQLQPVTLQAGGLSLQASLHARQIVDNPAYSGSLSVAAFNPRPVLQDMMGALPKLADDNALTQVAVNTQFQGTGNAITLKPLAVDVDTTKITGSTTVTQFDDPRIEFAINVDALDLDRYLPPHAPRQTGAQQAAKAPGSPPPAAKPPTTPDAEIPLPVELLRALNIHGNLSVGRLKALQVQLAQLQVGLNAKDGVVHADPVQAQLYQGTSSARLTLDVRNAVPLFSAKEALQGVEFGPLVQALMSDDYVSGVASIQANISTRGTRISDLKRQLNGDFGFDFANGIVKYLDLADILIADYAGYVRQALPPEDTGKTTAFRILKGTANITNGVVSNNDLYLQSARFQVHGAGSVDLAEETMDYTANTEIVNPTNQMSKYDLDKLVGVPIPVHFRGSFSQPKYSADWEGALRQVAKQRIKQEQKKLREEAKQKLKEEEQKLKDKTDEKKDEELRKLEEKLREKFKKIF